MISYRFQEHRILWELVSMASLTKTIDGIDAINIPSSRVVGINNLTVWVRIAIEVRCQRTDIKSGPLLFLLNSIQALLGNCDVLI